jgi:hypothetical protein
MGSDFGINGLLFDIDSVEDDYPVIGFLEAKCTIVGDATDHFCTYVLRFHASGSNGFGSVVATGSLEFIVQETSGYLLVTGAEQDFSDNAGGVVEIRYLSTEEPFSIQGSVKFP